ncbi:hypothetical protein DPMN_043320 [Dreissena polymorpha]|uniref:Uncharacterized protein n=1 Tax=Dreissena polymorpha TaxID=45954 RepID=A0A9D4HXU4_DREPO|nr:hypothetical protein DPMN_043320 [Dreissena polymorpha]
MGSESARLRSLLKINHVYLQTLNIPALYQAGFYYACTKKNESTPSTVNKDNDIIGTNLMTKFHEDRKINLASRVLTRKNAPPPGSHVFQPTGIIFELFQDIIGTNLLTEFHEDRTVNVASRFFPSENLVKNAPPLGSHVFQANIIIFELIQDIIETNLLTKFNEEWTLNVASRVLTNFTIVIYIHIRKSAPPLLRNVFQAKVTLFKLIQDIIGTNLMAKFHEDRKINVASRVLTRKNAPPPGGHVFQPTGIIFELFHEDWTITVASRPYIAIYGKMPRPLAAIIFQAKVTIFELIQYIIKTNLLSKFHEDRKINVASRVLTRKNAPPLTAIHVFQANIIIFELIQDIIQTNLLNKFNEDWTLNVASRVLTNFTIAIYSHIRKNAPPLCSNVFQAKVTLFKLIQDIIGTNLMTKFHEDRKINVASRVLTRKNSPPPGGHVFQPTGIIFELVQDIFGMNLLTKFHEDWTINVALRVHIRKNAPPLGSHNFSSKESIKTNLLSKFHEDRKINVASRVLTRKNAPPPGGHVFQLTGIIFEKVQDIFGMNLLTKFHEDWTINVASRAHIRKNAPPLGSHNFSSKEIIKTNLLSKFHEDRKINVASRVLTRKNAPPPGGHVFSSIMTIFELVRDIHKIVIWSKFYEDKAKNENDPPPGGQVFLPIRTIFEHNRHIQKTHILTEFHDDWTKNVTSRVFSSPRPGGHVFSPIWTIFELVRDINESNVLTKFHDDWAKIVTTRVTTAPPPGGHTNILTNIHENWASNVTSSVFKSFELSLGINGTNVLTKFHEDQAINVASRVFTRQNVDNARRTTDDEQKAITKAHHKHVVLR